jgi:hypothetical protein
MAKPTREAMIGNFVHTYRERIRPFLSGELGDPALAELSIADVEMRFGLYCQEFREWTGGAPEVWYKSAIAGLKVLKTDNRLRDPRSVARAIAHVDEKIAQIEERFKDDSDYKAQARATR